MKTSRNKEDKKIESKDGVEEEGRTGAPTGRLQRELTRHAMPPHVMPGQVI
jgi:hypothetical protein